MSPERRRVRRAYRHFCGLVERPRPYREWLLTVAHHVYFRRGYRDPLLRAAARAVCLRKWPSPRPQAPWVSLDRGGLA